MYVRHRYSSTHLSDYYLNQIEGRKKKKRSVLYSLFIGGSICYLVFKYTNFFEVICFSTFFSIEFSNFSNILSREKFFKEE